MKVGSAVTSVGSTLVSATSALSAKDAKSKKVSAKLKKMTEKSGRSLNAVILAAKIAIYSLTTGVFLTCLLWRRAYKNLKMGTPILACTVIGLLIDLFSLWIPAGIFYGLTFLLLLITSEVAHAAVDGGDSNSNESKFGRAA